jgi:hypothetical protein
MYYGRQCLLTAAIFTIEMLLVIGEISFEGCIQFDYCHFIIYYTNHDYIESSVKEEEEKKEILHGIEILEKISFLFDFHPFLFSFRSSSIFVHEIFRAEKY